MLATCWLLVLLLHHCFGAETTALGTHPAPLGSTKVVVHFGVAKRQLGQKARSSVQENLLS